MFNREELVKRYRDFNIRKRIDLEKYGIKSFDKQTFNGLNNLIELNLRLNRLQLIPKEAFDGLFHLSALDLSANELEKIESSAFNNLIALKSIDLFHNQLKNIDKNTFSDLKNLVRIDLSNNQLKQIDKDAFKGLTNLSQIDLSKNELQLIDEFTFRDLPNLKVIDLSHNKILKIHKDIFRGLFNLTHIYLNNNELQSNKLELFLEKNVQFISFRNDRDENNIDSIFRPVKVVKEVERTPIENLKCGWLKEVIDELEHLLKNKMINYDVKPAVIVLKEGEVELKDYGDEKRVTISLQNLTNVPFYIIKM